MHKWHVYIAENWNEHAHHYFACQIVSLLLHKFKCTCDNIEMLLLLKSTSTPYSCSVFEKVLAKISLFKKIEKKSLNKRVPLIPYQCGEWIFVMPFFTSVEFRIFNKNREKNGQGNLRVERIYKRKNSAKKVTALVPQPATAHKCSGTVWWQMRFWI